MNTFAQTLYCRAWSPGNKQMYYLDSDPAKPAAEIHISADGPSVIINVWNPDRHWLYNVSDPIFMLCTGRTDKNGKKIYEGDIKREEFSVDDERGADERIYHVCTWIKELCRFVWLSTGDYTYYEDNGFDAALRKDRLSFPTKNTIIVGNCFENPGMMSYGYGHTK